jgi:hypothetical protein
MKADKTIILSLAKNTSQQVKANALSIQRTNAIGQLSFSSKE